MSQLYPVYFTVERNEVKGSWEQPDLEYAFLCKPCSWLFCIFRIWLELLPSSLFPLFMIAYALSRCDNRSWVWLHGCRYGCQNTNFLLTASMTDSYMGLYIKLSFLNMPNIIPSYYAVCSHISELIYSSSTFKDFFSENNSSVSGLAPNCSISYTFY